MEPDQIKQLVEQVAGMLQQGEDPNAIVDMLVQEGLPEDQATQIVDEASSMAEGGGGGEQAPQTDAGTVPDGSDPNQLIDEVLQSVGPNVMLALLEAYDALGTQGQAGLKQQLSQMSQETESQQGSAEAAQPQQQPGQEQMFG